MIECDISLSKHMQSILYYRKKNAYCDLVLNRIQYTYIHKNRFVCVMFVDGVIQDITLNARLVKVV